MKCEDIQRALVGYGTNCLWSPQKTLSAMNTTGVVGWEADALIVHPSDWIWEVEIKVSASDFRREFKEKSKTLKHKALVEGRFAGAWANWGGGRGRDNMVRKFFFAMPVTVYEKVKDEIPAYAGVILLDEKKVDSFQRLRPWIERRAKDLTAQKAKPEDRQRLLESVYYRSWRQKEPKAEPEENMKLLTYIIGAEGGLITEALRGAFRVPILEPVPSQRFTRSGALFVDSRDIKPKAFVPWARALFPEAEDPRVLRSLIVEGSDSPEALVKLFASLMSSGWAVEFVVVRGASDKKFQAVEEIMRDSLSVIGADLPSEEIVRRLKELRGVSSAITGAV